MAGMARDTGSERSSAGPPATGPSEPAAADDGCGACTWDATTTPTAASPPMMSRAPITPASRARRLTGRGGRAYPVSGHEPTTRKPAMRGHLASPNAHSLGVVVHQA